ncbi:MAG: hypothetical protein KKA52_08180 [Candidatus Omnitrophica bacterium]|nr:hypothetical protein [Candidatus Omnitrophota bacterium]
MFKKPYYLTMRIIACILIQAFLVTNIVWAQGMDILPQKQAASNTYLSPQVSLNIPDIQDGFAYFARNQTDVEAAAAQQAEEILYAKTSASFKNEPTLLRKIRADIAKFAGFIYDNLLKAVAALLLFATAAYAGKGIFINVVIDFSLMNEITAFIVAYIAGCGIAAAVKKAIDRYAPNISVHKAIYLQSALTAVACLAVLNHYFYYCCLLLFSVHMLAAPTFVVALMLFARETNKQHRASIYDKIEHKELKDPIAQDMAKKIRFFMYCDSAVFGLNLILALCSAYPLVFFPVNIVAARAVFNRVIEYRLNELIYHIMNTYGSAEEMLREHINHRSDIGVFMFTPNRTKLYHLTTGAAGTMAAISVLDGAMNFYRPLPNLAYRFYPWRVPLVGNIQRLPASIHDESTVKMLTAEKNNIGNLATQRKTLAPGDKQEVITLKRLTSGFLMSRADILYPEIRDKVLKYGDDLKALRELKIVVSQFQKKQFKVKKERLNKIIHTLKGDYPELTQIPVYLVTGLDRVAEYIPDQAILVDNRPPAFIIELALIDEAMHRRYSILPLAEQEILSVRRQAMELDKIFARRGLDFKRAMGMLSQYDAHAKTDFAKMLGLLYGIRYLDYIEQRRRIVDWAKNNKGVFDEELAHAFEALGTSLVFKTHTTINRPLLIEQAI